MDKEDVVHIYNGILFSHKKNKIMPLVNSPGGVNLPANAGGIRDVGSIPGSGRSPGGGHSNPLQFSCLENPMDREA